MGEVVKRYRLSVHKKCHGDVMYTRVIEVNKTPLHILKITKRADLKSYHQKKNFL